MKPLIFSKTFLGVIVMILGLILQHLKVPVLEGEVEGIVTLIIEVAGAILAIYGRYKAQKPIGGIFSV